MRITIDAAKCTGCRSCELACNFTRSGAFNPSKARIKVVSLDYVGFNNPVVCRQCQSPKCVASCPSTALTKTNAGYIRLDTGACIGCKICVSECVAGAIKFDEQSGIPLICDGCNGKPACIEWCPTGALKSTETASEESPIRDSAVGHTITRAKPYLDKSGISPDAIDWYRKFA